MIGAPTETATVAAVAPSAPMIVIVVVPDSSGVTVKVPGVDDCATVATAETELCAENEPLKCASVTENVCGADAPVWNVREVGVATTGPGVGDGDGLGEGDGLGMMLGAVLGLTLGAVLGLTLGAVLGLALGALLGAALGRALGAALTVGEGLTVGDGLAVGDALAVGDGLAPATLEYTATYSVCPAVTVVVPVVPTGNETVVPLGDTGPANVVHVPDAPLAPLLKIAK